MPNATPTVVEKQLVDIDFSGGLNEFVKPENLDWTKFLKVADNVDWGTAGVVKSRAGIYSISGTDDSSVSVSSVLRLLSTSSGVVAIGGTAVGPPRAFQLDGNAQSAAASLRRKNIVSEYSVTPQVLGGISGTTGARMVGAVYTPRYNISVYTPSDTDYFVVFSDKDSGNIVRSYQLGYSTSSAAIALVSNRYLHVYLGQSGSAVMYQFDTDVLPVTVPSSVSLASGNFIVGAVAVGAFSYAVCRNAYIARVGITPSLVNSAVVAGFDANQLHDVATDGTSLYISGLNSTPRGLMKVVTADAGMATTRTVTDTDATVGTARISVGTDTSANACLLAHYVTTVGAFSYPTTRILTCAAAGTSFTGVSTLPGWGQFSSPVYNSVTGQFYACLIDLPGKGLGAGHDTLVPAGANCLVSLTGENTWPGAPKGFHIAAITDAYLDFAGANIATTGSLTNPQHLFTADSGATLVMSAIQRIGPTAFNTEFRTLKLDVSKIVCSNDIISGGKTSTYDGSCVSELGCVSTPTITVVDAGSGTGLTNGGVYNYIAFFEFIDALGRRHLSRCSNPFTITMAANHDTTYTVTFPTVSDHWNTSYGQGALSNSYNFKYHVYRTISGGSQYLRVASTTVITGAATTATLSATDSTTDVLLAANDLLHRQPGTLGTALDRYYAPASSCAVRHKDRAFCARGNNVYFSSFDVFGEAPWFNPAFSFAVFGGVGNITALASMDGMLVIFKKNAIFVVDGDGPPENGGNGADFSPPRKLMTEFGCVDARTVVSTDNGIMFRSGRGIEMLSRNLTVSWVGQPVATTVNAYTYPGGSAFDTSTGRCIWLMSDQAGTYQGQLAAAGNGYAVVLDTNTGRWSRYKLRTADGYGFPFQDVCLANAGSAFYSITAATRLVYADSSKVWFEYGRKDHDSADSFIPVTLETGWVKGPSKSDNIRVTDLYVLANRNADCTAAFSYATDYSTTYTAVKTFTPSVTGAMSVIQLEVMPPKEAVQSMSFKVVTSDPTPTSFGAGSQWDIFGLSVRVGLRGGTRGLAAAQRG